MNKITDKNSYLDSIKNRNLKIYLMGELIKEPLDHPIIRPSVEAMAETYELAVKELSLIHISEPTRPLYISYAVFCLKNIT